LDIVSTEGIRPLRIVSGTTGQVEDILNALGAEYAPQVWNFAVAGDRVIVTVVLLSQSLLRQAAIAQASMVPNGGRR
jgi:hypothetical protein